MCLLGALVSYVQADCYPGDTVYTQIVQEIYHGVTSDKIVLTAHGNTPMSRSDLCEILVTRHNTGKNPGQKSTNQKFLGTAMTLKKCLKALTYTTGYDSASGWEKWSGCHKGTWYGTTQQFIDPAKWFEPSLKEDDKHTYAVQSVRFDSEDRIENCKKKDMTGATCRYGWNQSAKGVSRMMFPYLDNLCYTSICMFEMGMYFLRLGTLIYNPANSQFFGYGMVL